MSELETSINIYNKPTDKTVMKSIGKHLSLCLGLLAVLMATSGCGKISDVVNLKYNETDSVNTAKSSPFLGLTSTGGVRNSGSFQLNAGVGNYLSSAHKTSGGFSFHGGIQGQLVAP